MKKEKDIVENTTVICDRQGYYRDAYYCEKHCVACPYQVEDIDGNQACYSTQYKHCDIVNDAK